MTRIPSSHPRASSLKTRAKLVSGYERGIVASEGLLAHGRGEALDYMIGEKSLPQAKRACKAAAAAMLLAASPVISVNGNAAALCPRELVRLASACGAALEANIFYGNSRRRGRIAAHLRQHGAKKVLGACPSRLVRLHGTDSARRRVDRDGMRAADLVVVPLEDGDRAAALKAAGKTVIAFDLNPLSRTAAAADITIVDNIARAAGELLRQCRIMRGYGRARLERIAASHDNGACLAQCVRVMGDGLERRARGLEVCC